MKEMYAYSCSYRRFLRLLDGHETEKPIARTLPDGQPRAIVAVEGDMAEAEGR